MNKILNYTFPETSKAIGDLGIRWKASQYWQLIPGQKRFVLKDKLEPYKTGYPAYNVTELGHMIPFGFFNEMKVHKYLNRYFKVQMSDEKWKTFTSEAEARARYLIDLIKSGQVQVEGVINPDDQVQVSPKHPLSINK